MRTALLQQGAREGQQRWKPRRRHPSKIQVAGLTRYHRPKGPKTCQGQEESKMSMGRKRNGQQDNKDAGTYYSATCCECCFSAV